ncbi:hypothetical protein [Streptomyces formicae]|uniref:Uncharacterized protein n=1 Tax=Streptomyces formicae TaxID=1616117 RepID=A0A291Q3Z1_9ACTN|nr:hypothetical protein [Streptomyces formicae]ATL26419.1 hypothetical protein KY5_1401c [Streptomyces formicae]
MSTEAPRSPIPPRPTTPPRPGTAPPARPGTPPDAADRDRDPEPPPAPSARFPDVPPPVDRDWVLGSPRPRAAAEASATADDEPGEAARIEDLLAPFEQARAEREAAGALPETPPPPPASARLPDAPPRIPEAPAEEADASEAPSEVPVGDAIEDATDDATDDVIDDVIDGEAERMTPLAPKPSPQSSPPPQPSAPPQPSVPPQPSAPPVPPVLPAAPTRTGSGLPPARGVPPEETTARLRPVTDESAPPEAAPRTADVPPAPRTGESPTPRTGENRPRATAARRAVGAVDLTPGPGTGRPFVSFARPALYDDSTTRLRPVGPRPRAAAAAACFVIGLGLIGGAVTGSWLTGESGSASGTRSAYAAAGELWHSAPVDTLFPPVLKGEGAGPGGADRSWTRIAIAPDSGCAAAFDPLLKKALAPVGCLRLLRATYTDATRSHVTTVGLLFTKANADGMRSLRTRFTEEGLDRRPDLMPRPYAAKGTPAEGFGDAQRASWIVSVLPDAPVVAYAVSGFADGRAVTEPESATEAMGADTTSAPAQSGLGYEAKGIADRVERGLRKTIAAAEKSS